MASNSDSVKDEGRCIYPLSLRAFVWPTLSLLIGRQTEQFSIYIANEMAFAHNAMIRGINSIYNQAPHVHKPKDIADLLFFAKFWGQLGG